MNLDVPLAPQQSEIVCKLARAVSCDKSENRNDAKNLHCLGTDCGRATCALGLVVSVGTK